MDHHLAQYNIGTIVAPLDSQELAEFVAALDPINAIAESSPGFVWRLTDESGQSSSYVELPGNDDPLLIVNYSIWEDLESLKHFINKSGHFAYLRRRREWFVKSDEETSVAWWVQRGEIPSISEAHQRLMTLRQNGPSQDAFTLSRSFPPPSP